jgi:phosphate transport system substrate-binding protein
MLCAAQPALADGAVVRVGGTGIALAALQQVGASLTAAEPGIRVDVLPSMGTPGGIKALVEGAIDVAVVARALMSTSPSRPTAARRSSRPGWKPSISCSWTCACR